MTYVSFKGSAPCASPQQRVDGLVAAVRLGFVGKETAANIEEELKKDPATRGLVPCALHPNHFWKSGSSGRWNHH